MTRSCLGWLVLAAGCAGCSYDGTEEMDRHLAAIEARVPKGTPLAELPGRMQALGFACVRAPDHLACMREERYALVCTKRVRAMLLQQRDALSGVLVNAGLFCL